MRRERATPDRENSARSNPTRTISAVRRFSVTLPSGMWVVTRATVRPRSGRGAWRSSPRRSARRRIRFGRESGIRSQYMRALWIGPVTTASISLRDRKSQPIPRARPGASRALPEWVCLTSALPIRPAADNLRRAICPRPAPARMISGPMPAGSPSVMADAFAHVAHSHQRSVARKLEGLDVSLRAQTGEPVFLQLLRLILPQPRLDIGPHILERFHFTPLARFPLSRCNNCRPHSMVS